MFNLAVIKLLPDLVLHSYFFCCVTSLWFSFVVEAPKSDKTVHLCPMKMTQKLKDHRETMKPHKAVMVSFNGVYFTLMLNIITMYRTATDFKVNLTSKIILHFTKLDKTFVVRYD